MEFGGRKRVERVPASETQLPIPLSPRDAARIRWGRRLRIAAVAVVIAVAAGLIYKRVVDPRSAREAYAAGQSLMAATRYDQAALNFTRAIELMPNFADAYRMRGRIYAAQYRPEPAIQDFTRVIQLDPRDPTALVERGIVYLQKDKPEYVAAIADAAHAVALNPKLPRAYSLRGVAEREAGRPLEALEDFTRAVKLEPNLENLFQRASTYQLLGRHALAIADLTAAIQISPQEPHFYYARALSEAALGNAAAARSDAETGRKLQGG